VKNLESNILGQFVKIVDTVKIFRDLNQSAETDTSWPNQQIRNKACELEWGKYKYTPMKGDIGEVVSVLNFPVFEEPIYIIRTYGMFYIPITDKGFEKINVRQSLNT
jgi:hypothetical protein